MIIEQHYDDEILIALLENSDEIARDKHVSACRTCAGSLESLRGLTSGLHDQTVWDERELPEAPRRETKNAIRGFAAAGAAERADRAGHIGRCSTSRASVRFSPAIGPRSRMALRSRRC